VVAGSFEAGDVVFFDSRLVHCTSRNKYDCFRISMDSRWCISPVGRKNFGETYHSKFIQNMSRDFSCEK
jgi:ectoine hydroxylase-related dioxygenase (phytanoyl-CoA dioxygenase family)